MKIISSVFLIFLICCKGEITDPQENSPYIVSNIEILDNRISNLKITANKESFIVIEFDAVNFALYDYNVTELQYYSFSDRKYKLALYGELDEDLINGHNKFAIRTDRAGFDYYNQQYRLVHTTRLNMEPMIISILFNFEITRK